MGFSRFHHTEAQKAKQCRRSLTFSTAARRLLYFSPENRVVGGRCCLRKPRRCGRTEGIDRLADGAQRRFLEWQQASNRR
jgi:hypothetical protein